MPATPERRAPSAVRMASSRERVEALARSRLATLAQAMTSTRQVAANMTPMIAVLALPLRDWRKSRTRTPRPALESG